MLHIMLGGQMKKISFLLSQRNLELMEKIDMKANN